MIEGGKSFDGRGENTTEVNICPERIRERNRKVYHITE